MPGLQRSDLRRKRTDGGQAPTIAVDEPLQHGTRIRRWRPPCALQHVERPDERGPDGIGGKSPKREELEERVEVDREEVIQARLGERI